MTNKLKAIKKLLSIFLALAMLLVASPAPIPAEEASGSSESSSSYSDSGSSYSESSSNSSDTSSSNSDTSSNSSESGSISLGSVLSSTDTGTPQASQEAEGAQETQAPQESGKSQETEKLQEPGELETVSPDAKENATADDLDAEEAEQPAEPQNPVDMLEPEDEELTAALSAELQEEATQPQEELSVALANISVAAPPEKTTYEAGEALDLTGLLVTAAYADGSEQDVTVLIATDPAEGTVLAETDTAVTVSYTESDVTLTANFAITVGVVEPVSLAVLPATIVQGHLSYIHVEYSDAALQDNYFALLDKNGEIVDSAVKGSPEGMTIITVTAPQEPGVYEVVALLDGKRRAEGTIEVVAYNENIWKTYTTINENGFVVINFNEDITTKNSSLTVNEERATGQIAGNRSIVTSVKYESLPDGESLFSVSGVNYPRLYPDYTFTFTAKIAK